MRALIVLLLCPLWLNAEEKPKLNALTPKEIEEGWIMLFDGVTMFGWKTEGDVKVDDGQLRLGGEKKSSIETTTAFGACQVRVKYFRVGQIKASIAHHDVNFSYSSSAEPLAWWTDFSFEALGEGSFRGQWSGLFGTTVSFASAAAAKKGNGAAPVILPLAPSPVRFEVTAGSKLSIRSIKLKATGAKPLFNAKDLTGWKVFEDPKRNKSKWTVTKEGWLNVKNGPGDLQTEKKYDDFILQLDCISNGKALNSGIFFRCIEKEYQNGYEMQIHNGYFNNDRAKPSDFGTGAIYRRVKARKVVPNDNEWFGMTLVAQGNHLATWVNGYQTVDWTDDRKSDENPRNGSKIGAGHISIQGHDSTTDLSFRNLRIVEWKKDQKK